MIFRLHKQKNLAQTLFVMALALLIPLPAFAASIEGFIYNLCIGFGGFFLWIGGMMLDTTIKMLIIDMGSLISNQSGIGAAINQLWTIVRDIFNILFIFGLIYIGFQTILNSGGTNTKRLLGMLIAAALLINFSLFATKAIIDFSNIAAFEIYKLMNVTTEGVFGGEGGEYHGISGAFMKASKLQTYSAVETSEAAKYESQTGNMKTIGYGFLIMIFLLATAFVFMAGALVLITRFLILIILMIFSPILLLGWVVPSFEGESKKRFKMLLAQSFIAPAYLFMLYLSLVLVQQLPPDRGDLAGAMDPKSSILNNAFGAIIYVIILVGLVMSSIIVARKLGDVGADKVTGLLNSAQDKIRAGAQGTIGRNTVGRAADWSQKKFDSFDAKNGAAAKTLRAFGLDRSVRGVTEAGRQAKFGSSSSRADILKTDKESRQRRGKKRGDIDLQKALRSGDPVEIEKAVRGMSKAQLEEVGTETLSDPNVMRYVSNSQMADIQKSDEFDDIEKAKLSAAREVAVASVLSGQANQPLTDVVGKASSGQLEALGFAKLKANAAGLTAAQIDDLKKSKVFVESEVQAIAKAREDQLILMLQTGNTAGIYAGRNAKEIAKLPKTVLLDPSSVPHIDGDAMKQILDNQTLNPGERTTLASNLTAPGAQPDPSALNYLNTPHGQHFII